MLIYVLQVNRTNLVAHVTSTNCMIYLFIHTPKYNLFRPLNMYVNLSYISKYGQTSLPLNKTAHMYPKTVNNWFTQLSLSNS